MNYIDIPTPSNKLRTFKCADSPYFRPAATSSDAAEAALRIKMEYLEITSSDLAGEKGFIASAAHTEKESAINNAMNEAVERLTLGYWWSTGQGFVSTISEDQQKMIRDSFSIPSEYSFHIGFIRSTHPNRYTAVAILDTFHTYPYTVLGGATDTDKDNAMQKAFIESLQSWSASEWLHRHSTDKSKLPRWDIGELRKRAQEMDDFPQATRQSAEYWSHDSSPRLTYKTLATEDGNYIAWVYGENPTTGTSQDLARLAISNSAEILRINTHSQHNF